MSKILYNCIGLSFSITLFSVNFLYFLVTKTEIRYMSLFASIIAAGLIWWDLHDIDKLCVLSDQGEGGSE